VSDGVTLTAVPLVAEMFPGVITPVPLVKTPVRPADAPAVTAVGLAVKLVMVGCGTGTDVDPPEQPVRLAKARPRENAQKPPAVTRFIVSP
jgi:hypothetical protein